MLRAACIQMNSGEDTAANMDMAAHLLAQAAARHAQLAVLPENFAFMSMDDAARSTWAAPLDASPFVAFLRECALRHRMAVIGGGLPLTGSRPDAEGRAYNAAVAVDASGAVAAVYRKMHLFDASLKGEGYRESASTLAGQRPVQVDIEGWRIGLAICFDLRFPALFQHHAQHGAAALVVTAAFTVPTGRAHWEALLRARAIENQCFVLAAAQAGTHPGGRRTWGHSMIIDPWGRKLAGLKGEKEGVIVAELKARRLAEVRRRIPLHPAPMNGDTA
ncbi:MAG: carbon-nitrogen hydrolase family protein [Mariprofundaceae bacterium]